MDSVSNNAPRATPIRGDWLSRRREWPARKVIYWLGLVPALWLFYLALTDQLGADPMKTLEHALGLWSLKFIVAGLAITPLRRLSGPQSAALPPRRRAARFFLRGIAFGGLHCARSEPRFRCDWARYRQAALYHGGCGGIRDASAAGDHIEQRHGASPRPGVAAAASLGVRCVSARRAAFSTGCESVASRAHHLCRACRASDAVAHSATFAKN